MKSSKELESMNQEELKQYSDSIAEAADVINTENIEN
jgi:hypothetical protein